MSTGGFAQAEYGHPALLLSGVGSILDTVAKDTEDTGDSVSLSLS